MIGKPLIALQPSNVEVNSSATAMFTCNATAYPQPSFTWKHGSTNLTSTDDIGISATVGSDPYSSTLTLSNVKSSNAGNYSCLASNNRGNANSVTASLTVYGRCSDVRLLCNLFYFVVLVS